MDELKGKLQYIMELEKLKTVKRFNRTLDHRQENSAEHSWQAALVALSFQHYYPHKVNIDRVIQMLLMHELGEIYAGDTWVFDDEHKADSYERESQSLEKTLSCLGHDEAQEYRTLWHEFEIGKSYEARYARIIDALIPMINHLYVSEPGYNPDKISVSMLMNKKGFIKAESDALWQLALDIIEEGLAKGFTCRINKNDTVPL